MHDLTGRTLKGRYRIEGLIGRGGMAEVYKAWDARRQYHVAIKVMREDLAEDLEFLRRFQREAQALAALSHANIVRFYSLEREGALAFIVMDYVEGITLRRRILEGSGQPLPLDETAGIVQQVCAALHYAHAEGVLHRDIKPGNIMLQTTPQTGEGPQMGTTAHVLVADFGIAKAADSATLTIVMPGTPAYMSPEQCRSQPLDARTDVYSLGVVVYEMLAGRRPFRGEEGTGNTRERIRWEQMHAEPPPLHRSNPHVPPGVAAAVRTALAKDAAARWPTVQAFWQNLSEGLGMTGAIRAPMGAASTQPAPPTARQPSPGAPARSSRAPGVDHRPRRGEPGLVQPPRKPRGGLKLPTWVWGLAAGTLIVGLILILASALWGGTLTPEPTALARLPTQTPLVVVTEVTPSPSTTPRYTPTTSPPPPPSSTPPPAPSWTPSSEPRMAPEQAVREYYSLINNSQYDLTWALLSNHFKDQFLCCLADGSYDYPEYLAWWTSVREVQLGTITLLELSGDRATILVNLRYSLHDGRTISDTRPRIYLIWDPASRAWLLHDKTE
jgi:serine/threonine-protein kinase